MKRLLLVLLIIAGLGLRAQNPYFEISKQMEIYNDVLKKLSTNYIDEINFGDLIQKNTRKMLNGLDRFTTFYDEQGILNQRMRQEGHFGGLGVNIQIKDSAIVIKNIYKNSPAAEAFNIGDKIIEIEGQKIADIDRKLASNLLTGKAGSEVSVVIDRNGKILHKKVKRGDIKLDAVTGTYLDGDILCVKFQLVSILCTKFQPVSIPYIQLPSNLPE